MTEPIESTPAELAAELATLRQVNAEIIAKRQKDKEKLAALEAASTALQDKATEAEATIYELTVNGPLKALATSISTVPDVFREFFLRDYKVEMVNGKLTLLSTDGKPVMNDGKAVPFELEAIKGLLLASKDESKLRLYNSILITSKASGAATEHTGKSKDAPVRKAGLEFGLR
jgi:hypothetical protein